MNVNDYLTVSQAARLLGLAAPTVRYHERLANLKSTRICGVRFFKRADVEAFAKKREKEKL